MRGMLIFNPAAGQKQVDADLRTAVRYLEEQGWHIAWRQTLEPGDAIEYAREAVEKGYDVAIAAGGDGTIGQVVNGLANSKTSLGVLPVGTTNVWAREMGIPQSSPLHPNTMQEAVRILAEGYSRRVDLGMVNDRYFLMWAGIGFDAQVTARVEESPAAKRRLGKLAFIVAVIVTFLNLTGTRGTVWLDGKKISGRVLLVVVSNIRLYGAIVRIAPRASLNDGLLDVSIFSGYQGLAALRQFISALLGLHVRDPDVTYHQARNIILATAKPLLVQADGDVVGTTPVEIRVVPEALTVIVPRQASTDMLWPAWARDNESVLSTVNAITQWLDRLKSKD